MAFYLSNTCLLLVCFISSIAALPFRSRIIGGDLARPGQFPFLASIQVEISGMSKGHGCGGSIINNKWILTASHCLLDPLNIDAVIDPKQLTIVVGTNVLDTNGTNYTVDSVYKHEGFDYVTLLHDIGLIKVKEEIQFTDTVQSISIGAVSGNDSSVIVGWGITDEDNQTSANELRYLNVTALSPEVCDEFAKESPWDYPLGPEQVCVYKSVGHGACHGDSGGPLLFDGRVVGITSYLLGAGCAAGLPDVYTRTSYYIDWIEKTIKAN